MRLASVWHIPGATDLLILCHHGVSKSWPSEFSIAPRQLERQLRYLLRRGYKPATLSAALAGPAAGRTLVVSFDDAYLSVLESAFPLLSRLGVPATVFAPTAYMNEAQPMAWAGMEQWLGTPFERELLPMGWDGLRHLRDAGWEIGSHSRTHPDLVTLGDEELKAELLGSREDCERELGRPCSSLAYPFSSYDGRVKDVASEAGYEAAVILDTHVAIRRQAMPLRSGSDPFEMLRAGIYGSDGWGRFLAKTSLLARRARASKPLRLAMQTGS